MDIGESLVCQPDKIKHICEIFNGLNGEDIECWEGYDDSLQEQNEAFTGGPTVTNDSSANLTSGLGRKKQRKKNKVKNVASTSVGDISSLSIEEARRLLQPHIKPQQTNLHKSNARSKKKKKAKKKKQSKGNTTVNRADIDTGENGTTGLDILSLCGT